jgi:hypothetical protein
MEADCHRQNETNPCPGGAGHIFSEKVFQSGIIEHAVGQQIS